MKYVTLRADQIRVGDTARFPGGGWRIILDIRHGPRPGYIHFKHKHYRNVVWTILRRDREVECKLTGDTETDVLRVLSS